MIRTVPFQVFPRIDKGRVCVCGGEVLFCHGVVKLEGNAAGVIFPHPKKEIICKRKIS